MASADSEMESALKEAKLQQQQYYELLPEWTRYKKNEYHYLKQNIGFALFGPPTECKDSNECKDSKDKSNVVYGETSITNGNDITEVLEYAPKAEEIINTIYTKVYEFGHSQVYVDTIHYGIIYNVILMSKTSEGKTFIDIRALPIFKVKTVSNERNRISVTGNAHVVTYIDINGRVYKSWTDYKENNTLPKCTMVLPKSGYYQPDESFEISENYSTVCVEIVDSPACSITQSILTGIDTTSNVVGIAGLVTVGASLVTPIGPLILGGAAVAAGLNSVWTIGRSTQNLVDRSSHEESINPLVDGSAFGSWLALTGSTVGLAATGGTALLKLAAERGKNIGNISKFAYNSLVISNIGINGVGIGYSAYCMYQKYQAGEEIGTLDVLFFGTHILFFGSCIINLQFANEIIHSTQGKVIDDYRAGLRSKRLRKAFNRAKRKAAEGHTDTMSENAEIIRYINTKQSMQHNIQVNRIIANDIDVSFKNGKIWVNGIALLDPMKFVALLIKSDVTRQNASTNTQGNNDMFYTLRGILSDLLNGFRSNNYEITDIPDAADFNETLRDMNCTNNASNILPLIFEIALALLQKSGLRHEHLQKAVHFIWRYVKENLRQFTSQISASVENERIQEILDDIIEALFSFVDNTVEQLAPAFATYVRTFN